jgi:hypothetical protein
MRPLRYGDKLIFVIAALLRLSWLWKVSDRFESLRTATIDYSKTSDAGEYVVLARNLCRFSIDQVPPFRPTAFRGPGYPLFLYVLSWGDTVSNVLIAQCLLGAASALLVYHLAMHVQPRLALSAGLCMALAPLSVVSCSEVLTETLYTFLIVLGCYFWMTKKIKVAGFILGVSWLVRPTTMAFLMFALLIALVIRQHRREVIVMFAVATLAVSPWIIRNAVVFHQFIPVAVSGGAINLLSGTFDINYGENVWSQWRSNPELRTDYESHDTRTEKLFLSRAITRISSHPLEWLKVRIKQYPRFVIDLGAYLYPANLAVTILIKLTFLIGNVLFLLLGLWGLWICRFKLYLSLFPAFLLLVHLPLWVEARYSLPMVPFFVVGTAIAVDQVLHRFISSKVTGSKPVLLPS